MTKKRKNVTIAFFVIGLILSGLMLFIAFYSTSLFPEYNEENTVEHSATVSGVETSDKVCTIYVLQYRCGLKIKLSEIVCDEYLSELQPGSNITFRVPDFYDQWLTDGDTEELSIVALQTENADIVTFESHNVSERRDAKKGKIIGCVFSAIFFAGAAACAVLLIVDKRKIN